MINKPAGIAVQSGTKSKKNLIDIKKYDAITVFVSSSDPNFTIRSGGGKIRFDNNFNGCLNFKSKEIDKYMIKKSYIPLRLIT